MSTARPLSEASQTVPPAYPAAEALHRELSCKDTQKTLKNKHFARLRLAGLAAARQYRQACGMQ